MDTQDRRNMQIIIEEYGISIAMIIIAGVVLKSISGMLVLF